MTRARAPLPRPRHEPFAKVLLTDRPWFAIRLHHRGIVADPSRVRDGGFPERGTASDRPDPVSTCGPGMRRNFEATVSALCYSIVRDRCATTWNALDATPNAVVRLVLEQHARMPDYLRFPLLVLTLLFDWASLWRTRHRFHGLPPEQRLLHLHRWRTSRFSVCRDLIRFYESLAVLAWHSLTEGRSNRELHCPSTRRALAG